jgi:hypothetical protein
LVAPRLIPRSEKNIAKVTMKDGSPVSMTSQPLISPMRPRTTKVNPMAGQTRAGRTWS